MLILIYKTRKANVSHADGANEESLVENEKKVIINQKLSKDLKNWKRFKKSCWHLYTR